MSQHSQTKSLRRARPNFSQSSIEDELELIALEEEERARQSAIFRPSARDIIYINQAEQVSLQDWEYCITRTTGRGSVLPDCMLIGDCNPDAEDHWILKRESLRIFHSKHVDNPSLYDDNGELTEQGK